MDRRLQHRADPSSRSAFRALYPSTLRAAPSARAKLRDQHRRARLLRPSLSHPHLLPLQSRLRAVPTSAVAPAATMTTATRTCAAAVSLLRNASDMSPTTCRLALPLPTFIPYTRLPSLNHLLLQPGARWRHVYPAWVRLLTPTRLCRRSKSPTSPL